MTWRIAAARAKMTADGRRRATAAPNDNRIVNADRDCELIAGAEDKGAALIDEDSRASAEETLYVMGAPGMAEKLISAHEESLDDCASTDNLGW